MKRLLLLPFLLALVVVATPSAQADPLTLVSIGNNTFRGTSAGPYDGLLNGSPITMVCLSFDRHVQVGQTWQVAINSLDAAGVANALFGAQPNALLNYQRAAWLYDQMLANPNEASAIQGAIWNIFNSSTPDTGRVVSLSKATRSLLLPVLILCSRAASGVGTRGIKERGGCRILRPGNAPLRSGFCTSSETHQPRWID